MPERASVFESTQIGVEALGASGTAVDASKRLLCTGFDFQPDPQIEPYSPFGSKASTVAIARKEMTEGSYEGKICPNDLLYLFSGMFGNAAITTPGGATLTRRWTWLPKNFDPNIVRTFTIEKGSSVLADRFAYGLINSMTLNVDRDNADVSGECLGRIMTEGVQMYRNEIQKFTLDAGATGNFRLTFDGQQTANIAHTSTAAQVQTIMEALSNIEPGDVIVTKPTSEQWDFEFTGRYRQTDVPLMTYQNVDLVIVPPDDSAVTVVQASATPTEIEAVPISPKSCSVFFADSVANLATGRLTRVTKWDLTIGELFNALMTLDDSQNSFSAHYEVEPNMNGMLTMEADSASLPLLSNLRNTEKRFMRFLASQGTIEAGFPYRVQITMPVILTEIDRDDEDGLRVAKFSYEPVWDSTLNSFMEVVIDTDMTSL